MWDVDFERFHDARVKPLLQAAFVLWICSCGLNMQIFHQSGRRCYKRQSSALLREERAICTYYATIRHCIIPILSSRNWRKEKYEADNRAFVSGIIKSFGDRGNIICMVQRLKWRGIDAEVREFDLNDKIDFSKLDIVIIGGSSDREQLLVCNRLKKN